LHRARAQSRYYSDCDRLSRRAIAAPRGPTLPAKFLPAARRATSQCIRRHARHLPLTPTL
jgi:hypothetical protein